MKTTTNIIHHAFALFAFACFALSPQARATCQDACLTNNNTVQGDDALLSNTTGFSNSAIGSQTLHSNTTGYDNTAIGNQALFSNTIGLENTATGAYALQFSRKGGGNTATGAHALQLNTNGDSNTAVGAFALQFNRSGFNNTATGNAALAGNTVGLQNTANGTLSLGSNTTGSYNTGIGHGALASNTTGLGNTAIGMEALYFNTTGNSNIALGNGAGFNLTRGNNNIDIGNVGVAVEANTIRIGTVGTQTNAYVSGISGATVPTGVPVIVDTAGHLGTTTSSVRFKDAIKPMDKASEAILALKPVTFRYKHDLDPAGIPQFGLVAEQVEKVNPDLVAYDEQGKPYTVRYEAVNAMLLNEFLKAHRKMDEQESAIARQQKQIDAVTAGLQKVSARLATGLSRALPETVVVNQ